MNLVYQPPKELLDGQRRAAAYWSQLAQDLARVRPKVPHSSSKKLPVY